MSRPGQEHSQGEFSRPQNAAQKGPPLANKQFPNEEIRDRVS